MNFKLWLELWDQDEEWSYEDIQKEAENVNSQLTPPFPIPDHVEPDDFLNHGGVFSFTYSDRLIEEGEGFVPEGLRLGGWATVHADITRQRHAPTPRYILTGRYGVKDRKTPVVSVWNAQQKYLLIPCLKELITKHLIRMDAFVFDTSGNQGTVAEVLHIIKPRDKKFEIPVEIAGKTYQLYEIPAMLHVLPSGSPEHKAIADFICQDTQYPYLRQFRTKAKCPSDRPLTKSSVPDFTKRQEFWPTSENQIHL